jgi:hypothetical protein
MSNDAFFGDAETTDLGSIARTLHDSLIRCGYGGPKYHLVPGGFALVSQLERIDYDGGPYGGADRFRVDSTHLTHFNLKHYLRALLYGPPGRYRVFVFVVTPESFVTPDEETSVADVEGWYGSGLTTLPADVKARAVGRDLCNCMVLVYEFERDSETDEPRFVYPGRLTAVEHLRASGIAEGMGL